MKKMIEIASKCKCYCEKYGIIPLSCFAGEELQFAKNEHYCNGEVKKDVNVKKAKHPLTRFSKFFTFGSKLEKLSSPSRGEGKCAAFTLAEVLITLTIIGVIAALTIPNLMQKWQDHSDVVKVKTAYSLLGNALKMAVAENGALSVWDWPEPNGACKSAANDLFFIDKISKNLKIQQDCNNNNCKFGWDTDGSYTDSKEGVYKTLTGQLSTTKTSKAYWNAYFSESAKILKNGMLINISIGDGTIPNCTNGYILVDINGKSKPNKKGYDVFYLPIATWQAANDNLILSHSLGHYYYNKQEYCNAQSASSSGNSCAYWVLRKGNMDYKYRDVSAEW